MIVKCNVFVVSAFIPKLKTSAEYITRNCHSKDDSTLLFFCALFNTYLDTLDVLRLFSILLGSLKS